MAEDYNALLNRLFRPGVEVNFEFVTDNNLVKSYNTRVEDLEQEYLVLQSPLEQGQFVQIEEGQELTLWCETGQNRQAYVTSVFVVENRPGEVPLLVCCKPRQLEQGSLRRYSRYRVDLGCVCTGAGLVASGRVTDISLGGCRMELDLVTSDSEKGTTKVSGLLTPGLSFQTMVNIPDQPELVFDGRATRVFDPADKSKVGLALDIYQIASDKKEILKYFLFQCQLAF